MPRWRDPHRATHRMHNPDPLVALIPERHGTTSGRTASAGGLKLREQQFVCVVQAPHADQDQRIRALGVRSRDLRRHPSARGLCRQPSCSICR
jgi:hypothetical protein